LTSKKKFKRIKLMIIKVLFVFTIISLFPGYCYSAIYKYIDENGVFHFTNILPIGKKYEVVVRERHAVLLPTGTINNTQYDKLITRHATTYKVDPSLVKAVVKAESNFNPRAVSPKGARGLMQLMPETAKLMKVGNVFDPDQNIRAGAGYLKMLEEIFEGNLELILAAYNAGPMRVIENNMRVPPIEETINFINRVKFYYNTLKNRNES